MGFLCCFEYGTNLIRTEEEEDDDDDSMEAAVVARGLGLVLFCVISVC
jgi:hypothetical protein